MPNQSNHRTVEGSGTVGESVQGGTARTSERERPKLLYYPCCGHDLADPMRHFVDDCEVFWFVDRRTVPGIEGGFERWMAEHLSMRLIHSVEKRVEARSEYLFRGEMRRRFSPRWLEQIYRHVDTGRMIKVVRKRGLGEYTFRHHLGAVDVFFYRGDSWGEGGSGIGWLKAPKIYQVLEKLVDGGLLVTDGSNSDSYRGREEFIRYRPRYGSESESDEALLARVQSFRAYGCSFDCEGLAGHRYGPTLVWRVQKRPRENQRTSVAAERG